MSSGFFANPLASASCAKISDDQLITDGSPELGRIGSPLRGKLIDNIVQPMRRNGFAIDGGNGRRA